MSSVLGSHLQLIERHAALAVAAPTSAAPTAAAVEVEVRFHDVTVGIFERVRETLTRASQPQIIDTTDYYVKGVRYTVTQVTTTKLGEAVPIVQYRVSAIEKKALYNATLTTYPIKIAVSTERKIDGDIITDLKAFAAQAELIRIKQRFQFSTRGGQIVIDMTRVTEERRGERGRTRHEIEAEVKGEVTTVTLKLLDATTTRLMALYFDTSLLYTLDERRQVITDFNSILGGNRGDVLDHETIVQARNLKRRDCVWGGLLGGKVRYAVTSKAAGLRKQLYFHQSGVWLVFPPLELNRLTTSSPASLYGSIFDGENIPRDQRQGNDVKITASYYYLPFDVMAFQGKCAIQNEPLLSRLKYRDELARIPANPVFVVRIKEFVPLGDDMTTMEAAIAKVKSSLPQLGWKSDGMMMTPIDAPYNPHSDVHPLRDRVLTMMPDTCKLKPWDQLTIDLRVQWTKESGTAPAILWVNKSEGEHKQTWKSSCVRGNSGANRRPKITPVHFTGSAFHPLDVATQVNWDHPLFRNLGTDTIVEFGPKLDGNRTIVLQPVLIRTNKTNPNRLEIAEDVWSDINNPLTEETLEGSTLDLVFQYHNQIKRELFHKIPAGADVVDIGFGQGGDIGKMVHLRRIVAVEPNPKNMAEAQRRAALKIGKRPPMAERIRFVQVGGEESEKIIAAASDWLGWTTPAPITGGMAQRPPLYITMMLSLSFFWRDAGLLDRLATTLQGLRQAYQSVGGKNVFFYFMTIDGAALAEAFQKLGAQFDLGPARFELHAPNRVQVHIKDSIVEDQTEYLVQLSDLTARANLTHVQTTRADRERFLSATAASFSRLYIYGTAVIEAPATATAAIVPATATVVTAAAVAAAAMGVNPPESGLPPSNQQSQLLLDPAKLTMAAPDVKINNVALPVSKTGIGDDVVQVLGTHAAIPAELKDRTTIIAPKGGEYVRISNLHEGNSFFHAFLKTTSAVYNRATEARRLEMATELRTDLLAKLRMADVGNWPDVQEVLTELYKGVDPRVTPEEKKLPLNAYYFTLSNGFLYQLTHSADLPVIGFEYLEHQLRANVELPVLLYYYLGEFSYVNINIYRIVDDKLTLTQAAPAFPFRAGIKAARARNQPFIWSQPTIMLKENDGYIYEAIGHRASATEPITTKFDSKTRSY